MNGENIEVCEVCGIQKEDGEFWGSQSRKIGVPMGCDRVFTVICRHAKAIDSKTGESRNPGKTCLNSQGKYDRKFDTGASF